MASGRCLTGLGATRHFQDGILAVLRPLRFAGHDDLELVSGLRLLVDRVSVQDREGRRLDDPIPAALGDPLPGISLTRHIQGKLVRYDTVRFFRAVSASLLLLAIQQ